MALPSRAVGALLAAALFVPALGGLGVAAAADGAHAERALTPAQGESRVCGCSPTTPGTGERALGPLVSTVGTMSRAGDAAQTADTALDNTSDTVGNTTTGDDTTDTTNDTVGTTTTVRDDTTDTVDNTTADVDSTIETTNDTIDNTTDTVGDAVETSVVDSTTDTVDSTIETTNATVETTPGGSVVGAGTTSSSADVTTTATQQQSQRATTTTTDGGNASVVGGAGEHDGDSDTPLAAVVVNGAALLNAGAFVVSSTLRRATLLSFAYPVGIRRAFFPGGVPRVPGLGTARRAVMTTRTRFGGNPRDWLWRLTGLVGYSRYDDSDPLDNERRREIHDCVQSYPGIYPSAIGDRTDTPLSTVRYHLDVLTEESLLDREPIGGKRRYFPPDEDAKRLAAALRDSSRRAILETLAERGAATGAELADDVDRNKSTIAYHLGRLQEEGLVEREREGRTVVNRPTPEVSEVLGGSGGVAVADD